MITKYSGAKHRPLTGRFHRKVDGLVGFLMTMQEVRFNAENHSFHKMTNSMTKDVRYFVGRVYHSLMGGRMASHSEITKRQGRKLEAEGVIAEPWAWT